MESGIKEATANSFFFRKSVCENGWICISFTSLRTIICITRLGPKDIFPWRIQQKSLYHWKQNEALRGLSSVLCITHWLKPDFTVMFISLCSPLLHYRIWSFSITIDFFSRLFHETTKQETLLHSNKWVCFRVCSSYPFLATFFLYSSFGFVHVLMIWQIWGFVKQISLSVVSLTAQTHSWDFYKKQPLGVWVFFFRGLVESVLSLARCKKRS